MPRLRSGPGNESHQNEAAIDQDLPFEFVFVTLCSFSSQYNLKKYLKNECF